MMNLLKVIVVLISLIGMTTIHASNDGSTPEGPGLFSGESGEFDIGKLYNKLTGRVAPNDGGALSSNPIETINANNYSAFKEWSVLNQQNPELYNSFDDWLEYKKYLQQKK